MSGASGASCDLFGSGLVQQMQQGAEICRRRGIGSRHKIGKLLGEAKSKTGKAGQDRANEVQSRVQMGDGLRGWIMDGMVGCPCSVAFLPQAGSPGATGDSRGARGSAHLQARRPIRGRCAVEVPALAPSPVSASLASTEATAFCTLASGQGR